MKMLSATISHEYLNIDYLLNDKDADSSFSLLLKDFGLDENVKTGIGFATSDVGLSRAYVYPFFMTENGYKTRFGDSAGGHCTDDRHCKLRSGSGGRENSH